MGRFVNAHMVEENRPERIYVLDYEPENFMFGFRCEVPLQAIRSGEQWETVNDGSLLAVSTERVDEIPNHFEAVPVASFAGYRVSRLTSAFFDYRTRDTQLSKFNLVRLKSANIL